MKWNKSIATNILPYHILNGYLQQVDPNLLGSCKHLQNISWPVICCASCYIFKDVLSALHQYEFLEKTFILNTLAAETVCGDPHTAGICVFFLEVFGGFSSSNINRTRVPVYIGNNPAGTSIFDVEHYCQVCKSHSVCKCCGTFFINIPFKLFLSRYFAQPIKYCSTTQSFRKFVKIV